jgi:hypothetical protein
MAQPIARIFETDQQARDAAAKLREEGFPEAMNFLVTPASSALSSGPPSCGSGLASATSKAWTRSACSTNWITSSESSSSTACRSFGVCAHALPPLWRRAAARALPDAVFKRLPATERPPLVRSAQSTRATGKDKASPSG